MHVDQIVDRHDIWQRHDARHVERGEVGEPRAGSCERERQSDLLREIEVVTATDRDDLQVGCDGRQQRAERARVRAHAVGHVRGLARIEGNRDHRARNARHCTASG